MEPEKSALVIIDLQNDFTLESGKAHACTSQVDKLIPIVNNLSEQFSQEKRYIAYLRTEWSNPIVKLLTKNSVKRGTPGAEFDSRLKMYSDNVFTKGDKNSFSCSNFVEFLENNSINHLYLAGLATDYCIKITSENAINKGYQVTVVSDAVAAYKCGDYEKSLQVLSSKGVNIIASTDI